MSVRNSRRMSLADIQSGEGDPILEGFLLKKRQKRMQGYARRYFKLFPSGVVYYSISRDSAPRDHVSLRSSAWLSDEKHRSATLDGGTSTWHVRFSSREEYDVWTSAFGQFSKPGSRAPVRPNASESGEIARTREHLEEAEKLVDQLAADLAVLRSGTPSATSRSRRPSSAKSRKEPNAAPAPSIFNIFTGKSKSPKSIPNTAEPEQVSPTESYFPGGSTFSRPDETILDRLSSTLDALRQEHAYLDVILAQRQRPQSPDARPSPTSRPLSWVSTSSPYTTGTASRASSQYEFFDAASSFGEEYALSDDEEGEEEKGLGAVIEDDGYDSDRTADARAAQSRDAADAPAAHPPVTRRRQLPAPISGDDVGILGVLKKNVGKDLTTISFPVSFNEPLSLLQKVAEDLEYSELIDKAINARDSIERMCYIAALCTSSYSCTQFRTTRKPFNPLLGETYEFIGNDFSFLAEKVVHQPPLVAAAAHGKGWVFSSTSGVKQKFWGKSMEIMPVGTSRLTLTSTGDVFTWHKPSSFIRNLVLATPYLEHTGDLEITNETTGERCVITFKEGTFWGGPSSRAHVSGIVFDVSGRKVAQLAGKWNSHLARQLDGDTYQQLWEVGDQFPPDAPEHYGFSHFAVGLNEITEDIRPYLPPTDTRFRPDQGALEEGDIAHADEVKIQLEEAQRTRRKEREARGETYTPRWFKPSSSGPGQQEWEVQWTDYWDTRARRGWDEGNLW